MLEAPLGIWEMKKPSPPVRSDTVVDIWIFLFSSKQFVNILKFPGALLLCETITLEFSKKTLRNVSVCIL